MMKGEATKVEMGGMFKGKTKQFDISERMFKGKTKAHRHFQHNQEQEPSNMCIYIYIHIINETKSLL